MQHTSDEEENLNDEDILKDDIEGAEALQRNLEERYFVSTPSTISRTECEVSTSQVDSSALENLPLKRENRTKGNENNENKFQLRLRESTGILKSQAGKIRTKLQNIKTKQFTMPERPKIKLPERPKFKMPEKTKISFPERAKFSFPDRPKFSLPDRRKFSLPDRPKFKKINISEKLTFGDRKKFTFPERPKFNVPDLSKFKLSDKHKVHFPSFSKKKDNKEDKQVIDSSTDLRNVTKEEFESKTYPRLFKRKKKSDPLTSSSPTLNREDTPPPTFIFTRVGKYKKSEPPAVEECTEQPREYGSASITEDLVEGPVAQKQSDYSYELEKTDDDDFNQEAYFEDQQNTTSTPDISPFNQEYTHVINEINNDEFFVRPRGISRENIQVREYLSDEIRQAFKIPKNVLASMGRKSEDYDEPMYANEVEADPELLLDENEPNRYSNEDINDRDDGYYTFPPVRPNRAKKRKKAEEAITYTDQNINDSAQFSEVDLCLPEVQLEESQDLKNITDSDINFIEELDNIDNEGQQNYVAYGKEIPINQENTMIQSQTLPTAPKRKKKPIKMSYCHSSLNDFNNLECAKTYIPPLEHGEDVSIIFLYNYFQTMYYLVVPIE